VDGSRDRPGQIGEDRRLGRVALSLGWDPSSLPISFFDQRPKMTSGVATKQLPGSLPQIPRVGSAYDKPQTVKVTPTLRILLHSFSFRAAVQLQIIIDH
jgi:hypothetical protein